VRHARQELARRWTAADSENAKVRFLVETNWQSTLTKRAIQGDDFALEALWSLNAVGGFNQGIAELLLDSSNPAVRAWTVRLLSDPKAELPESLAHRLDEFAEQETDLGVLQQVACTARRLPAHQAVPMINANITRDDHNDDPYLPLLWWWAVEEHR
jgi:hypothetical protein